MELGDLTPDRIGDLQARFGGVALPASPDPLGASRRLLADGKFVRVDEAAAMKLAKELLTQPEPYPWGAPYPTCESGSTVDEVVAFALAATMINICFFSEVGAPDWKVDGAPRANGLVASFVRARAEGTDLTDADVLANLRPQQLHHIMRGDKDGTVELPLIAERTLMLNDFGNWLRGYSSPSAALQGKDAFDFAVKLAREMPLFADVIGLPGNPIPYLKRAQLAAYGLGDLLGEQAPEWLLDRSRLTAFADYRVPQTLRHHGVIVYDKELAEAVDTERLLIPNSRPELEIRAATIVGVEVVSQATAELGTPLSPSQLDSRLWLAARNSKDMAPHHRCYTIWY